MKRKYIITVLIIAASCIVLLAKSPIISDYDKKQFITPCNSNCLVIENSNLWIKIIQRLKNNPRKKVVEIVTVEG